MERQGPGMKPELVPLAAAGDSAAWEVLVEAYTHRVYALLMRQCGDGDLAEELTQVTFVKVFRRLADYEEQGRFESWLFRIAVNVMRDEMRRRKRQAKPVAMGGGLEPGAGVRAWAEVEAAAQRTAAPQEDPLQRLSREESIEQLQRLVATLSEADREILHLRHTAGLSFPEIAATLEQPLGTVLARGHRALGKLRKLMEAYEQSGC